MNLAPELKQMTDGSGELLFNKAHTLMAVLSIKMVAKMAENADNFVKFGNSEFISTNEISKLSIHSKTKT